MTIERTPLPFGASELELETGRLAKQAHGSILATVGGTTVLVAVTHSDDPLEGRDFFPLMVDYREKFYAGGRIPGGFFRREGRPGDPETLKARITDRCIRPLFPEGMRHEVMVYITVISTDGVHPAEIAALTAASAALQISDIPFPVPMAGVQVGYLDGEYVLNPTYEQLEGSGLKIVLAGTRDAINMVEAETNELSEEVVIGALKFGHEAIVAQLDALAPLVEKVGKPKFDPGIAQLPEDVKSKIADLTRDPFDEMVHAELGKTDYGRREKEITKLAVAEFAESHPDLMGAIHAHVDKIHGEAVRKLIVDEKKRVDGRGFTQIRDVSCEVAVLAKTHGSALFTRGQTQALGTVTLGTLDDAQKIDNMLGISNKPFLLHYNFPPWCVGEARPMRATSRREIGHGTLAEKALQRVLPDHDDFPYTIRIVSEILESNGSSSMASVCVGCLAMMDAGVPIKKPVAGIAMGLVEHGDNYAVLTDIQGVEDHLGDMDFKVTGTRDGITALQMDIKIESVKFEVLEKALNQARDARFQILDTMAETLAEPRPELSPNAPRLTTIQIPVEKIGALIGPGGRIIRAICERTGVKIDVEDDGRVFIASTDGDAAKEALEEIESLVADVEMDRIYTGKVVRVTDFGAFVQLLPNKDGLLHISEMSTERINRVEDVCDVGDEVKVKVISIDDSGRVRVSIRALEEKEGDREPGNRGGPPRGGGRDRGRGGDRDRGRGGDRDRGRGGDRDRGRGGDRGRGDDRRRERSGSQSPGFRERKREKS